MQPNENRSVTPLPEPDGVIRGRIDGDGRQGVSMATPGKVLYRAWSDVGSSSAFCAMRCPHGGEARLAIPGAAGRPQRRVMRKETPEEAAARLTAVIHDWERQQIGTFNALLPDCDCRWEPH